MNCLGYEIPESFECARHTITVNVVDKNDKNNYGYWDDTRLEINIAKSIVGGNGDVIKLTEMQILNSFFHELTHVWQFFYNNDMPESQAQSFANLMCEYVTTYKN